MYFLQIGQLPDLNRNMLFLRSRLLTVHRLLYMQHLQEWLLPDEHQVLLQVSVQLRDLHDRHDMRQLRFLIREESCNRDSPHVQRLRRRFSYHSNLDHRNPRMSGAVHRMLHLLDFDLPVLGMEQRPDCDLR